MTLKAAYDYLLQALQTEQEEREARAQARLLLFYGLGFEQQWLSTKPGMELSEHEEDYLKASIARLLKHEPIQYVLGETAFCDLVLKVSPAVLIPRPETEELVEQTLKELKKRQLTAPAILDIGTGSGCIALGLKQALPQARVTGVDISREALQIARENAGLNGLTVKFDRMDILHLDETDKELLGRFDVIVSNPPYVSKEEYNGLAQHVRDFEPRQALTPEGEDTLVFYNAIARFAEAHLQPKGFLMLELNEHLADATEKRFQQQGFTTQLIADMQGKQRLLLAYHS